MDLPGIIEGAAQGKGRGRQVIAVARTADLVIIMLDATKPHIHRTIIENELESVGIRLNRKKPNIYFKQVCVILRRAYREPGYSKYGLGK